MANSLQYAKLIFRVIDSSIGDKAAEGISQKNGWYRFKTSSNNLPKNEKRYIKILQSKPFYVDEEPHM
jgi:hypothetical protein